MEIYADLLVHRTSRGLSRMSFTSSTLRASASERGIMLVRAALIAMAFCFSLRASFEEATRSACGRCL
jgi:hypothetical protein